MYTLAQAKFRAFASVQPPMGLVYLASVLRNEGAKVNLVDANVEGLNEDEVAKKILDTGSRIVGFTSTTPLFRWTMNIIRTLRKNRKDLIILMGGPHPSMMPDKILETGLVDIVVRGEGENTIKELHQYFTNGKLSLNDIRSISYITDGKIIHNPERPLIENLDELPFPSWDLLPIEKYHSVARNRLSLPIMTSRGCPFNCVFCYKGIYGRRYRTRSPENIIKEIKYLRDRYGIQEMTILDDNFTLNVKRVLDICDRIVQEKLVLPWSTPNGIRANPATLELFEKMKAAGCYRIYVGIESGDERVLEFIDKGITLEEVKAIFSLAKQAGLETVAMFMIGNLTETEETIDKTINLSIKLDPDLAQFTITTPYPGTKMHETILREGKLYLDSWENFNSCGGAIFEHGELTVPLLNRKYKEAYRRFYLRPYYILKRLKKMTSYGEIKSSVEAVFVLLKMLGKKPTD